MSTLFSTLSTIDILAAFSKSLLFTLAGMMIASLAGALMSLAISLAPSPFAMSEIVTWLMGALADRGWREVWIGYDPAKGTQNGDSAGCVVVAPPAVPGGKFRILERHQWRGMDFRAQADAIKKLTEQYNVTYIGIDSTGVGHGVYENVKAFFPAVREFVYNPNVKNALVLKAYDIISHRRLEFDAGHTDIAQSFMAIRRATTASGNRPTYEASRSEEASHADLAWATMHALFNEPLQGESANTSNIVEIF